MKFKSFYVNITQVHSFSVQAKPAFFSSPLTIHKNLLISPELFLNENPISFSFSFLLEYRNQSRGLSDPA